MRRRRKNLVCFLEKTLFIHRKKTYLTLEDKRYALSCGIVFKHVQSNSCAKVYVTEFNVSRSIYRVHGNWKFYHVCS